MAGPATAGPGPAAGSRPAGAPGSPAASVAERRLVSVLFADLVGFTPFAEGRDSEEVRETLSRYFDLASEIITRHGGIVEKFIGDAVMAVWGSPTAREDDAERSVRAALELVSAVRTLGPGIAARAGVVTGEAAVTLGATNQGMVAGDIVNTASRLEAVAAPGTVLVGEGTKRAASSAIAFEPAGEHVLKGKTAPVTAWVALRVVAERGGRGRSDTLEAPFVGRDDELRMLKDLYHATARERRTRLVSVTGIAGIGKSRLAWEFEKYLDGIVGTIWWHRGRSPAYGEGISFWALGEMIRGRAGLVETDDERTTRLKIADLLDRVGIVDTERRWVEPALLALLGVETGIPSQQLFGAWRTFFERLAESGPVVLVFEDLHWADAGTIDFIDHLLEWTRGIPLYVLTLARPELLDRRPDWGAGRRNFTSLYLEPLTEDAMRQLLSGLVPGLPDDAVRAVVGRAEGIPLYAVETVRMLVAEGKLAEAGGGTFTPVADLAELAIPETLTALIAARLDALEPADRSLVLDAAVIGQSFSVAGLAAVSSLPESVLDGRLRGLVRRELFAHETDPRSPERGQYIFVQALIREVAYNTLARKDRKVRHLAAARYLESLGTDEIAAALAGHYLAARENAGEGPEADALGAQARLALRGAAERAAALGGLDQALGLYEQALEVTTESADQAEILERAGQIASSGGHHETARRHLEAALALCRQLGDRPAIARAVTALGRSLNSAYKTAEAQALLEQGAAEFPDLEGNPDVIALYGQLARSHFLRNDNAGAIEIADRVLAAAEPEDLKAIVADTLVTKGSALAFLARPVEGLGALRAGQELAEAAGQSGTVLRAINNRNVTDAIRNPAEVLRRAREGLDLARRIGARFWLAGLTSAIGDSVLRTGDWTSGLAELEAMLAEGAEGTDRIGLLQPAVLIHAYRGEDASERLAEIVALRGENADPQMAFMATAAVAGVALAAGRWIEAREAYRAAAESNLSGAPIAFALSGHAAVAARDAAAVHEDLAALDATRVRGPVLSADSLTLRAGLAALEGRAGEALGLYREALQAWRDLGLGFDEALAGLEMVSLLDPADPEVAVAGEIARTTFARLGAQPFLARLEAAIAAGPATAR